MKYFLTLVIIGFISLNNLNSQVFNKIEIVDELKNYQKSPESYYNMKMEQKSKMEEAQRQISSSKTKVSELMTELSEKDKVIEELKRENNKLKATISELNGAKQTESAVLNFSENKLNNGNSGTQNVNSPYRVQIGRFSLYSLNSYLNTPKSIVYSNDGTSNVYEIAGFTNASDAFNLSQELRRLGINGAFVTKYNNGIRDRTYNYLNENPSATVRYGASSSSAKSAAAKPAQIVAPASNTPSNNKSQKNFIISNPKTITIPNHTIDNLPTPNYNLPKQSGNLLIEE